MLVAQRGEITTEEAAGVLKLPDDATFSNAQNGLYYGGLILLGSRARGSIMALSALGRERLQAVEKKKLKPIAPAHLTLTGVQAGPYRVEYWDPEEGKLLRTADLAATRAFVAGLANQLFGGAVVGAGIVAMSFHSPLPESSR